MILSIKLKFEGFNDLISEIEKANGSVENSVRKCMEVSAEIMESELKSQMQKANVDKSVIDQMPASQIENNYGQITARVGYRKGTFNPKNLSTGYKVVFVNYGTPYRRKHGKIQGKTVKLGFIQRAKNRARSKIKREQEKTLKDILRGLE